jgi:hypothetical protein
MRMRSHRIELNAERLHSDGRIYWLRARVVNIDGASYESLNFTEVGTPCPSTQKLEPKVSLQCPREPPPPPPYVTSRPISWRFIWIFSSHLCVCLPSGLFPSCYLTQTLYALLSHASLILPNLIILIIFGKEYKFGTRYRGWLRHYATSRKVAD